jgi:hypothetical protein
VIGDIEGVLPGPGAAMQSVSVEDGRHGANALDGG